MNSYKRCYHIPEDVFNLMMSLLAVDPEQRPAAAFVAEKLNKINLDTMFQSDFSNADECGTVLEQQLLVQ